MFWNRLGGVASAGSAANPLPRSHTPVYFVCHITWAWFLMNRKFRLDSSIQHPISGHVLDGPAAFSCTKLQIDVSNESLALQEYT